MSNDITIEWAAFRVRPGVTEPQIRAASTAIQEEFIARQPGFLRRELLRADDGSYVDVLWWRDRASAETAMAAAMQSPACARYFELMESDAADPAGVKHLAQLAAY